MFHSKSTFAHSCSRLLVGCLAVALTLPGSLAGPGRNEHRPYHGRVFGNLIVTLNASGGVESVVSDITEISNQTGRAHQTYTFLDLTRMALR